MTAHQGSDKPTKGNSAKRAALRLVLLFVPAALFVLGSDWYAGRGIFYYKNSTYSDDRAADEHCRALQKIEANHGNSSADGKSDAQRDSEQKTHDSCQQWRSAQAAERSAWYGGLQALASLIGMIFSFAAVAVATAAAVYAKNAAIHTESAASEARRQANAAERALHGLERPRLFFEVVETNFASLDKSSEVVIHRGPNVTFEFTNAGRGVGVLRVLYYDLAHLNKFPDELNPGRVAVFPGKRIVRPDTAGAQQSISLALTPDGVASLRAQQSFIWLYGWLEYSHALTIDDNEKTEFCWYYDGFTNEFKPYYLFNRMT